MSTSRAADYAVGSRTYRGVSSAPNIGPVKNREGYDERDRKYKTRRRNRALLNRLKAKQKGRYMSSDYLSAPERSTL
jgi:hypothetical protein